MRPYATGVWGLKLLVAWRGSGWNSWNITLLICGVCWRMLAYADVCWRMLTPAGPCASLCPQQLKQHAINLWRLARDLSLAETVTFENEHNVLALLQSHQGICWRMLTYAIYVCWRMLTYAIYVRKRAQRPSPPTKSPRYMLTYADVCYIPMLTYADVCYIRSKMSTTSLPSYKAAKVTLNRKP
jgi:hypothetical protein